MNSRQATYAYEHLASGWHVPGGLEEGREVREEGEGRGEGQRISSRMHTRRITKDKIVKHESHAHRLLTDEFSLFVYKSQTSIVHNCF